jgi:hypothetical protein
MRRRGACCAAVVAALVGYAAPAHAAFGDRTLRIGSRGGDVRTLQSLLGRVGHPTAVDGVFGRGTQRSVRAYERAEDLRVDGRVSPMEARGIRRRAASAAPAAQDRARATLAADRRTAIAPPGAPPQVVDAIAAANKITRKPYRYGGGHARFRDSGYDCSGSVSFLLHGGGLLRRPLDSTGFMSWGERGRGEWVTIRTNPSHAYLIVAGLRFDTSARSRTGNRWSEQMRSASGYVARHPEGL